MRFDELIVGEDEYPHRPCQAREEWLLMYSRGVPVPVIARWCRVDVRRVRRCVDRRTRQDPRWFGRCLLVHDQPRPGTAVERRAVRTRDQVWWKHYDDVAAYMGERDGALPRQNDSPQARTLYLWVKAQRRQHDSGNLTQDQIDALDRLGEWQGAPRGNRNALWDRRLNEVEHFVTAVGRLPRYDPTIQGTHEAVFGVWIGTQRTLLRKGRLRADRRKRLDHTLPGWI